MNYTGFMNKKQERAVKRLKNALECAGKCGLQGGVYGSSFCLWPSAVNITHEDDSNGLGFFEQVEKYGIILHTPSINLDGGTGV